MADNLAGELAKAKGIADGLQFACRLPNRKPDFFACGGPAAEAYWDYFTPARVPRLLAALEAVLKLADDWDAEGCRLDPEAFTNCATALREAITKALNGDTDA